MPATPTKRRKQQEELLKSYRHILEREDRIREFHFEEWIRKQKQKQYEALPNRMKKRVRNGVAFLIVDESQYKEATDAEMISLRDFFTARIDDLSRALNK